jgi:drug/metabolite transporter (DMT)-like permease
MVTGLRAIRARGSMVMIVLAFASIYIIWGSTYLAIRYAIETIPPLVTAGVRHLIAGSTLLAWALARGYRPTSREWYSSAVLGFLFFLISHGSLHWAEQTVPSGLAALLVATEPMWVALLALFMGNERQSLTVSNIAGLVLGFVGVVLLTTDHTIAAQSTSLLGAIAILAGTLSWSFGMFYAKQAPLPKDTLARSAMSMFCGSIMLLVTALVAGEFRHVDVHQVTGRSILGLAYLIVFGSIVAFTAYTWLLEHCTASLIATHTYVNPVVAVLLGWLYAGEPITGRALVAGLLVVISVVCVTVGTSEPSSSRDEVLGDAAD